MSDKKKNARNIFLFLFGITVIGIIAMVIAGQMKYSNDYNQVGYYKEEDTKYRLMTFNVSGYDSLSDEAISDIKQHAKDQMHTEGAITYMFYYDGDAPNVTTAYDRGAAWSKANSVDYIAYAFRNPGGRFKFYTFEKPMVNDTIQ